MHAKLKWVKNMQFECTNNSHKVIIDAFKEHGGDDEGPSPKDILLDAMMGCTAMDTRSLLTKMRQDIQTFEMSIDAQKTTEHPIHFESAQIIFDFTGDANDEKVIKAVTKSLTKYCGINYMISKTCEITYKINLNKTEIFKGSAVFE